MKHPPPPFLRKDKELMGQDEDTGHVQGNITSPVLKRRRSKSFQDGLVGVNRSLMLLKGLSDWPASFWSLGNMLLKTKFETGTPKARHPH